MSLKTLSRSKQSESHLKPVLRKVSAYETLDLFEDILNSRASLRVRVTGTSMKPFLRGGEVLTIKKMPYSSLKRGDLIFFKRRLGNPVVHRIIKKSKDHMDIVTLQTKGDALLSLDDPVEENEILGKVCKIEGANSFNMETGIWRDINYLLAIIHLMKSRIYFALGSFKTLPWFTFTRVFIQLEKTYLKITRLRLNISKGVYRQ